MLSKKIKLPLKMLSKEMIGKMMAVLWLSIKKMSNQISMLVKTKKTKNINKTNKQKLHNKIINKILIKKKLIHLFITNGMYLDFLNLLKQLHLCLFPIYNLQLLNLMKKKNISNNQIQQLLNNNKNKLKKIMINLPKFFFFI